MNEAKYLVKKITEGIQEKKRIKNIVIADLSSMTIRFAIILLSVREIPPAKSQQLSTR